MIAVSSVWIISSRISFWRMLWNKLLFFLEHIFCEHFEIKQFWDVLRIYLVKVLFETFNQNLAIKTTIFFKEQNAKTVIILMGMTMSISSPAMKGWKVEMCTNKKKTKTSVHNQFLRWKNEYKKYGRRNDNSKFTEYVLFYRLINHSWILHDSTGK